MTWRARVVKQLHARAAMDRTLHHVRTSASFLRHDAQTSRPTAGELLLLPMLLAFLALAIIISGACRWSLAHFLARSPACLPAATNEARTVIWNTSVYRQRPGGDQHARPLHWQNGARLHTGSCWLVKVTDMSMIHLAAIHSARRDDADPCLPDEQYGHSNWHFRVISVYDRRRRS